MKKYALVFLSVFLFISAPFAAHANIVTATGKYIINAVKHTPGGAKVEATNTATAAKHVIKHGVSSADLGKAIGAGIVGFGVGTGAGLAFKAITGLALDAVDWVMDKENNRVKYKLKPKNYNVLLYRMVSYPANWYGSKEAACKGALGGWNAAINDGLYKYRFVSIYPDPSGMTCLFYSDYVGNSYQPLESKESSVIEDEWKYVPFNDLAQKDIELADGGEVLSQKDIEDYVTHLAKEGELDTELDNSTDITKPGKPETTCPSGTVKIGDTCIKLPDPDSPDPDSPDASGCGPCCSELLAILIATAKLNADFYAKSLDNDAKALAALNQINAQITKLNADFNLLLNEAKLTNKTLTEINEGQDLHFTELKQKVDDLKLAVETGNANILTKLSEVDASIKQTNEKLDKLNENLEKMQKCEGTEFNKKICDFVDWMQSEPAEPESAQIDIKDVEAENSNKIDMSGECPAPYELNFSVFGYEQNHSISYGPLCGALVLLKPIFVGSGALSGMFILMGYSRASNTGVNG
jgi:hypothetical protein